ncbi:hypothetical protein [Sulfurovum sp.]|uniref:hypothetical protein n=1 Tax=Sulfurovum sp. TaxID=1969726 RepID=UPI0025DD5419|nr:hypothetical protein [Sulfurovum sp.]
MIRGIETLGELEEAIRSIRNEVTSLDTEKEALFRSSQENKRQQAALLSKIAQVHFEALQKGEDAGVYRDDLQIERLLDQRESAFTHLQEKIEALGNTLEKTEEERSLAHRKLEEALMRLARIQEEVQKTLQGDPAYTAQLSKTQEAKEIAKTTAQKAQESIENYKEKMRPFEENELFWYLWQRHYSTSAYEAGGITKMLDGWVASLCDYEAYRVTYWTLSQIPERLEAHAKNKQKAYESELQKLIALEKKEAQAQGMESAKTEVSQKQQSVDTLDGKIVAQEHDLDTALQEQKEYLQEHDSYAREIVGHIESSLKRYGVETIYEISQKTASATDDHLVTQLDSLQQKEKALTKALEENRVAYEEKLSALRETEALRRRFKQHRYDDIHSGFENEGQIGSVLGEILGGVLNNAGAWERMSRHQRPLDSGWSSDFGSGGFTRADSPWYSPSSSSDLDMPGIGGMSDADDFRTGGGF